MTTQPDLFSQPPTTTQLLTVRLHFDGGAKGQGMRPGEGWGYGSYRIDQQPIHRCDHNAVMSANAAEVLTLCEALEEVARLNPPANTIVLVYGDSQIALACARRIANAKTKVKLKGSDAFQQSQLRLADLVRRFHRVDCHWLPRHHAVAAFGH